MSHFVFGRIYQGQPHEIRNLELLDVTQAARAVGLFARINEDIRQDVVNEMLSKQVTSRAVLYSFFLTACERDDTSDSIISPYCLKEIELVDRLSRVEKWTVELLRRCAMARIDLYMTEGYDESFTVVPAVDPGWGKRLAEAIYKDSYVDSICVQIPAGDGD